MFCHNCSANNPSEYTYCCKCAAPRVGQGKLMTDAQVAEMLHMSKDWVKKHCTTHRPILPYICMNEGERITRRFRLQDILAFIEAQHRVRGRKGIR